MLQTAVGAGGVHGQKHQVTVSCQNINYWIADQPTADRGASIRESVQEVSYSLEPRHPSNTRIGSLCLHSLFRWDFVIESLPLLPHPGKTTFSAVHLSGGAVCGGNYVILYYLRILIFKNSKLGHQFFTFGFFPNSMIVGKSIDLFT